MSTPDMFDLDTYGFLLQSPSARQMKVLQSKDRCLYQSCILSANYQVPPGLTHVACQLTTSQGLYRHEL